MLFTVFVAWVGLLVARCSTLPPYPVADAGPPAVTIYVIERGWHTDIGVPADEMNGALAPLRETFPGGRYFVFGFGDREYLLARHTNFADMVRALFPGPGAILVTALRTPPPDAFGPSNVIVLRVSRIGMDRISNFLSSSLVKDANGELHPLADGPYPGSVFYTAATTYDATYTCNTWAAEALQTGGLEVNASGVLFAEQVMDRARRALTARTQTGTVAGDTPVVCTADASPLTCSAQAPRYDVPGGPSLAR
jgi:uncharacterized protein (TIGR02117 family)